MEKIAVHVPNEFLSKAVQEHQFSIGNAWLEGHKTYIKCPTSEHNMNACINVSNSTIQYANKYWYVDHGYKIITVDEYFKMFEVKPIKIGSYEVKDVTEKGFNVGCQFISWETYDEIGKLRKDK